MCLLRAASPEGTKRPSRSSWTPSDISPSNNEVSQTPFFIMQYLSFTPEEQRKRQAAGLQALAHAPVLFELYLLLLRVELLQPVMAELRGRKLPPNLDLRSLFPFSLSWLRFGFVNLILPLCMWVTLPWSRKTDHALANKNRNESTAIYWMRERKTLPEETTNSIQAIPCFTDGGSNVLFSMRN